MPNGKKHVNAQATSGLSQSDYCRAHLLNIKYFSFCKGKLRKATKLAAQSDVNSIVVHYPTDSIAMLMLPANTKIYLAVTPVHMRKSFDGLNRMAILWK